MSYLTIGLRSYFTSLIQFEFIFVSGVRKCSCFILLHVAVQFSKHLLLKRLSFLHCIFLLDLCDFYLFILVLFLIFLLVGG